MSRGLFAKLIPVVPVDSHRGILASIGIIRGSENFEELGEVLFEIGLLPEKRAPVWPDRFLLPPTVPVRRLEIDPVQFGNELIQFPADSRFFFSEGCLAKGFEKLALGRVALLFAIVSGRNKTALKDRAIDIASGLVFEMRVENFEVSGEPEFRRKGAQDIGVEAIQSSEKKPRHPADKDSQELDVVLSIQLGNRPRHRVVRVEPRGFVRVLCGLGQLFENRVKEFSCRLSSKSHRNDSLRGDRALRQQLHRHESDVAVGELIRFP